jgi:hypothetical protein
LRTFGYTRSSQLPANDQSRATVFSKLKLKKAGQMTASQKHEESDAGTSIMDDWKTDSM